MNLFRLIDWDGNSVEIAKLQINNLSYNADIDFYLQYYAKLNNQTVAYGQTYHFNVGSPGHQTVISNVDFNPYDIKSYYTDTDLLYSLNTIGYLISGNYEIEIELKQLGNTSSSCTVILDSLYQTQ